MTNSADPDQLASKKPTDLDLHCLLRQGMSCLAKEESIMVIHIKPQWTTVVRVNARGQID